MLMLSQLKSGSSNFAEVSRTCSLLCTSWRIRLAAPEPDGHISCTKGCPDKWSRHVLPKLKSDKNSSSYLWEKVSFLTWVPCSCFLEGLYRADDTTIVVLTRHSDLLLQWQLSRGRLANAICWCATISDRATVYPLNLLTSRIMCSN